MKSVPDKKNMRYVFCFFPFIGVVIGAAVYAFSMVCQLYGFGQLCFAAVGAVLPALITDGQHLEGYLYTADALHAYHAQQTKEKKTAVIKSDRVGAFGVAAVFIYYLLSVGGLALIWKEEQLLLLGIGYCISRTLSGMAAVWFPVVKKDGRFHTLVSQAEKKTVKGVLVGILAICFCMCMMVSPVGGMVEALICMWVWTYYYYMSKKVFGGITGELAGYFLTLCELAVVLFAGVFGRMWL